MALAWGWTGGGQNEQSLSFGWEGRAMMGEVELGWLGCLISFFIFSSYHTHTHKFTLTHSGIAFAPCTSTHHSCLDNHCTIINPTDSQHPYPQPLLIYPPCTAHTLCCAQPSNFLLHIYLFCPPSSLLRVAIESCNMAIEDVKFYQPNSS